MIKSLKKIFGIAEKPQPEPLCEVDNDQPSISSIKEVLGEKVKLGIPLNLNEGREYVRREQAQVEITKEAHKRKEFPIHHTTEHIPDQMGQQKYLTYCLSLLEKEKPRYFRILSARMRGLSHSRISREISSIKGYSISLKDVYKEEAEAIRYLKQKIEKLRQHGTPIFGEPDDGKPKSRIIQAA